MVFENDFSTTTRLTATEVCGLASAKNLHQIFLKTNHKSSTSNNANLYIAHKTILWYNPEYIRTNTISVIVFLSMNLFMYMQIICFILNV